MTKSLEDIQGLEILHFTVPEKSLNTYAIKTRQKRTEKPSENTPSNGKVPQDFFSKRDSDCLA
jgi:hypothetical protein